MTSSLSSFDGYLRSEGEEERYWFVVNQASMICNDDLQRVRERKGKTRREMMNAIMGMGIKFCPPSVETVGFPPPPMNLLRVCYCNLKCSSKVHRVIYLYKMSLIED